MLLTEKQNGKNLKNYQKKSLKNSQKVVKIGPLIPRKTLNYTDLLASGVFISNSQSRHR